MSDRNDSDSVVLFPQILQPAAALKTIAPVSVKFWESQEVVLSGIKQYSDGWLARRQQGTREAIEAAKRMGEAATPVDALREYQDWLNGAVRRLIEDGTDFQRHVLSAGTQATAGLSAEVETAAKSASRAYQEQSNG
ncbi:hypothetical protein [Rhodopseudomonas palustris]|uniref:Phasin domain-containing protein n=1 Tax=Rhodopseudomonas palustris (strain BisB18) TaxID=316056 RepID=Q214F7_RHOPB